MKTEATNKSSQKTGEYLAGMKKRAFAGLLAVTGTCILLSGCGKKEGEEKKVPEAEIVVAEDTAPDEETVVEEDEETQAEEKEEDLHEGEAKSYLTGEWIAEDLARQRPISCMIGNTDTALPQYGVSKADIMYEAPVEGGLTRLMGIFQDYQNLEKLGSVRSSRLYYAYYSMEYDAIYLHYGQASYAQGFLESGQIDDLNGLEYAVDQAVIYRDKSKKAPHNAYATGDGLIAFVELKNYNKEHGEDYNGSFTFAKDDKPVKLKGQTCQKAAVVFPGYQINKPYFEYNSQDGLYYRYQYGGRHIDGTDGSQLAVKNIIMQNAGVRTLDSSGYLEVTTTGSGTGWYVTNGKAIDIKWERTDNFSPTRYYDSDGKEIKLNQGKTWVCVLDQSHPERVQFYADASLLQ